MGFFVDILLPIPLERLFTYSIDASDATDIQPGMRISVPFGKSKIYTGLAIKVHQNPPTAYEAKPIHQILDTVPMVLPKQLQHWRWISTYYLCTLGEVFRSAVPSAFLLESETIIYANKFDDIESLDLSDEEYLVLEALQHQSSLKVDELVSIVERKNVIPLINGLVNKKLIHTKEQLFQQYQPKMVKYVKLQQHYEFEENLQTVLDGLKRAPKQMDAVLTYFQLTSQTKKPLRLKELEAKSKAAYATIKGLVDKGIFEFYEMQTDRVTFEPNSKMVSDLVFNEEQLTALGSIKKSFKIKKPCLLHGVTSSGKTEVYVNLISEVISTGKQVLYLLPEIALTTQLIARLKAYFGNKIAVFHSKYSLNERVEVWNGVLQGKSSAQIVIGARSSIFLPFCNLGLVVVDEEHENSFKQFDPAPRYHGRDAAVVLAKLHDAKCLLGSATPSLESYQNTMTGKYTLAKITQRYGNVLMPQIELVDIKEATRKKRMKGRFSDRLWNEITETLDAGEQVIIFQNRRGFAPIVECTSCGHASQCPNCDVSLTFHQNRNQLRCHYCGYHSAILKTCQACGNATLDTKGFGTEQVQEELIGLFPDRTIGRMDLDSTRGKFAYAKIINAFEQHEMDILVGTQMVTKGLDFRNVGLVGVMNADNLLNFPDYRAHERSFQLLTQVAGRAGRTEKRGKVLIQTYNPYHSILQQVSNYDYDHMFAEQLYEREQFKYPPTNKIIKLTLKDKDYNKLNEASDWFCGSLRNVLNAQVLGPEYPAIARIRNQYHKHVIIKVKKANQTEGIKKSIKRVQNSFNAISKYRSIRLAFDVDHV
ncbi:Primosomal protein N' [Croceitalea dokdonensis DOKDO 023]|uniref:Replication restart protein PriA n=1 Tax=Croceitalea dokdonensis DOKDO 023 TaxID=1300341 RepID=A0A0P7B2M1_9FLAO|nr:primosomal protein N' [Croceitalea dokdonensis]KPM33721.1 Primosomal protein N' [Croceitalea dokdonensis DOKDO 023]